MPSTAILEPRNDCANMRDGLQARLHDPLWLLARQWQFGEFKGDDAGSPIAAQLLVKSAPITRFHPGPLPADPAAAASGARDYSPRSIPLETLVEREPVEHPEGKGVRLAAEAGLQWLRMLEIRGLQSYRRLYRSAYGMKPPAERERDELDDETLRFIEVVARRAVDGLQLYGKLEELRRTSGLAALFNEAPFNEIAESDRQRVVDAMTEWLAWYEALFPRHNGSPAWVGEHLEYSFAVSGQTSAGEVVLKAPEYLEGHLDWFSFVADPAAALGAPGQVSSLNSAFLPVPVSFRGMPCSRLWEFEDGRVNFSRIEAAPEDLARLLVVEFGLVYGNDWFVVPVELAAGSLCRIGALVVTNTFGERMLVPHASEVDGPEAAWRIFALSPDPSSASGGMTPELSARINGLFFLPPALGVSLEGAPLEEVLFIRDEMANLAWAVERVVESPSNRPLDRFEAYQEKERRREAAFPSEPGGNGNGSANGRELTYVLGTTVPDYWIPLLPVRVGNAVRLRRGSLPQMEPGGSDGIVEPQGVILEPGRELLVHDEEVPREGARVTRGFQYARWTDGSTHLWIGRRKRPGRGEGSSGLRFDVVT